METQQESGKFETTLLIIGATILFLFTFIQIAWIGDDAYITARSVENFIHGHGPNYNVGERVQTFTHPFWFLIISFPYFIMVNVLGMDIYSQYYYLVIFISLVFSLGTILVLVKKIALNPFIAFLGVSILVLSRSFMDYTTSGLETPLSYFLSAVFLWVYLEKRPKDHRWLRHLILIAALAALNRFDTILFFIPALVYAYFNCEGISKEKFRSVGLGGLPIFAWLVFSVIYYGFPFPNTAYAKLNTGINPARLIQQGIYYFFDSVDSDPITLFIITVAILWVIISKNREHQAVLAGVSLYLFYILLIGGGFMSGRFFSVALLIAVAILIRNQFSKMNAYTLAMILIIVLGFSAPKPTLLSNVDYGSDAESARELLSEQGIIDERAVYFPGNGLLTGTRDKIFYDSPLAGVRWVYEEPEGDREVFLAGGAGWSGYVKGPNVHVIDVNGLVDPLMAQLPIIDLDSWRIGHFRHIIPDGYIDVLADGENYFDDPDLWEFYQKLNLITRGDIFSRERFTAIWEINTGKYDKFLDKYAIRYRKTH
jgi:arabinofuranosyltransferase